MIIKLVIPQIASHISRLVPNVNSIDLSNGRYGYVVEYNNIYNNNIISICAEMLKGLAH
jgi:hypothetical protein